MNISVAMCTYNGEKFINEQIDSILIQLSREDELIISDDGSTDNTINIIKEYSQKDKRIRFRKNELKPGVVNNFQNAINHCKNEIIFFSDQDDIWLNNKVKKVKMVFRTNPEIDVVLSDLEVFDSSTGNVIAESFMQKNNSKRGFVNNVLKNSYIGCAMAVRKSYLNKITPFPKNIPMHDWWIGLNSELDNKTYIIYEPLIRYRRHENNVTGIVGNSFIKKIKFRITLIFLIARKRRF